MGHNTDPHASASQNFCALASDDDPHRFQAARNFAGQVRDRVSHGPQRLNQTLAKRGMRNGANPLTFERTASTWVREPSGMA